MRSNRIKRGQYIIALCIIALLTFGCGNKAETSSKTEDTKTAIDGEKTSFQEIGSYNSNEKYERMYDSYTDVVKPSDSYGKLVPYLGDVIKFDYSSVVEAYGDEETFELYSRVESDGNVFSLQTFGLCTAEGKIVTDPVYSQILYNDSYYLCSRLVTKDGNQLYAITDFVSEDGSIVINKQNERPIYILNNTEIATFYGSGAYSYDFTTIYNSKGQMLANPLGNDIDKNGLRYEGSYDETTGNYSCYLTDASGKKVSDTYSYCILTDGGYYITNLDEVCGVLDSSGKTVIPCECSQILYENGLVACKKENSITVYDDKLTLQYELDFSKYGEHFVDSIRILKIPANGIVLATDDTKAFDGKRVIYMDKNGQVICSSSYSPNENTTQNAIIIDEKVYSMKGEYIGDGIKDEYIVKETYDNGNVLVSTMEGRYYTFDLATQSILQEYSYYDREKKLAYVSQKDLTQVFEPSTGEMIAIQQSRYYYLDSAIGEITCYKKNGYSITENDFNGIIVKKFADVD